MTLDIRISNKFNLHWVLWGFVSFWDIRKLHKKECTLIQHVQRKNRVSLTYLHLFLRIAFCNLVFLVSFVSLLVEASESLSCDIICHLWCVETCRPDDRVVSLQESPDRQHDYHKRQLTTLTLSLTQFYFGDDASFPHPQLWATFLYLEFSFMVSLLFSFFPFSFLNIYFIVLFSLSFPSFHFFIFFHYFLYISIRFLLYTSIFISSLILFLFHSSYLFFLYRSKFLSFLLFSNLFLIVFI